MNSWLVGSILSHEAPVDGRTRLAVTQKNNSALAVSITSATSLGPPRIWNDILSRVALKRLNQQKAGVTAQQARKPSRGSHQSIDLD
jgi:hypothetical protein